MLRSAAKASTQEYLQTLQAVADRDQWRVLLEHSGLHRPQDDVPHGIRRIAATEQSLRGVGCDEALRRFRLLQYLRCEMVDPALAADHGWMEEPGGNAPDDLHLLAVDEGSTRPLCALTVVSPSAMDLHTDRPTLADRTGPLLAVEHMFGVGIFAGVPGAALVLRARTAEIKRLVLDRRLDRATRTRAVVQVLSGLAAHIEARAEDVDAYAGDYEPRVLGRLFDLFAVPLHVVDASAHPDEDAADATYLAPRWRRGSARPFAILTRETSYMCRRAEWAAAALTRDDSEMLAQLSVIAAGHRPVTDGGGRSG